MTDQLRPIADSAPETSREHIDVGTPEKLQEWADKLVVTPQALEAAVQVVGTRLDRVKDYLTGGFAGDQEDA